MGKYRSDDRRLPRLRANRRILRLLEQALESANLTNCCVDEKAQEAMRLYLQTWVAGRIKLAIGMMLKGKEE